MQYRTVVAPGGKTVPGPFEVSPLLFTVETTTVAPDGSESARVPVAAKLLPWTSYQAVDAGTFVTSATDALVSSGSAHVLTLTRPATRTRHYLNVSWQYVAGTWNDAAPASGGWELPGWPALSDMELQPAWCDLVLEQFVE